MHPNGSGLSSTPYTPLCSLISVPYASQPFVPCRKFLSFTRPACMRSPPAGDVTEYNCSDLNKQSFDHHPLIDFDFLCSTTRSVRSLYASIQLFGSVSITIAFVCYFRALISLGCLCRRPCSALVSPFPTTTAAAASPLTAPSATAPVAT